jgi:hypothetical protein
VREENVVDVVYTLRGERPRMHSSIPGRRKESLSVLRYPDRLISHALLTCRKTNSIKILDTKSVFPSYLLISFETFYAFINIALVTLITLAGTHKVGF